MFSPRKIVSLVCLPLLLAFSGVTYAQEDIVVAPEAIASVELPSAFASDSAHETTATLVSPLATNADGTSALEESGEQAWFAISVVDAALLLGAGFIGFILLSNRRS